MNREMNRDESFCEALPRFSCERDIAWAAKGLGYAPHIAMEGENFVPMSTMPWAKIEAARLISVDGNSPARVESQLVFVLNRSAISASALEKAAIAEEMTKDLLEIVGSVKRSARVVEVLSTAVAQPRSICKPSEQIAVEATMRVVTNYDLPWFD